MEQVDDNTFYKFATSKLDSYRLLLTQQMLSNADLDSSVAFSIAYYQSNVLKAEEMLGKDEENVSLNDRINLEQDSKEINNNNNLRIMNNKLSKEDIQKVEELTKEFKDSYNNDLSLEDNLSQFYLSQRPGTFPEDTHDIVESLKRGINEFNTNLQKGLADSGFDYKSELEKITVEMNLKNKYEVYVNLLAALMTLNVANLNKEQQEEIKDFEVIKSELSVEGEVTEEMLNEVLEKIEGQLNDNTLCIGSIENLRNIVSSLPNGTERIELAVTGSEEDVKNKLLVSMMSYIAYQNGEIEGLKGQEISPEAMAVAVSSSIEERRVIEDLDSGNTTVDKAIQILKIIAVASIISFLSLLVFGISALVISAFMDTLLTVFGSTSIATFGTIVFTGALTYGLLTDGVKVLDKTTELSSRGFDVIIDTWRKSVWPSLHEHLQRAWAWLQKQIQEKIINRLIKGEQDQPEVQVAPTA